MRCALCSEKAVINNLCKTHFIEWFERKALKTIKDFNMINDEDRIAVAVSGGKDSNALLWILNKYYNQCNQSHTSKKTENRIVAIAVDEGIRGYRNLLLKNLKEFTNKLGIALRVYSFEQEFGKPLDKIIKKTDFKNSGLKPCSVCGVFRRYLLNKHSKGFDKLATAHNLDDEAQSIIMNIFSGNKQLLQRIGPITSKQPGMVQRIKPFYFLKEKEVATYSFFNKLMPSFKECPYAYGYRSKIVELINNLEVSKPGFKENIVKAFLKLKQKLPEQSFENYCKRCGEPSSKEICKACEMVEKIVKK